MYPQRTEVQCYDWLKNTVDARIGAVIADVEPAGIRRALTTAVQGGKRVRPLLTMLSAVAAGDREVDALDAAVAIELLHTSSLIHDDIMDDSPLRRGRPTIHAQLGAPSAILAGDILIALSFQSLHRVNSQNKESIVSEFTQAFLHVCEGQASDINPSAIDPCDSSTHRTMVEKKTGKLFEAAAAIGALIGTRDGRNVDTLRRFGLCIGMAFQAKDDLLDAIGVEDLIGKPVGIDSRNGKSTYLRLAYPSVYDSRAASSPAENAVEHIVGRFTDQALDALNELPFSSAREHLRSLAVSLSERDS